MSAENGNVIKYGFLVLTVYFLAMAVAHYFGIKVPLLFVYYNVPFYAYQDKIISFAVLSYVGLFTVAAFNRSVVPAALTVLATTILGLASVNMSSALQLVLAEGQSTSPYWLQAGLFAVLWLFFLAMHLKNK